MGQVYEGRGFRGAGFWMRKSGVRFQGSRFFKMKIPIGVSGFQGARRFRVSRGGGVSGFQGFRRGFPVGTEVSEGGFGSRSREGAYFGGSAGFRWWTGFSVGQFFGSRFSATGIPGGGFSMGRPVAGFRREVLRVFGFSVGVSLSVPRMQGFRGDGVFREAVLLGFGVSRFSGVPQGRKPQLNCRPTTTMIRPRCPGRSTLPCSAFSPPFADSLSRHAAIGNITQPQPARQTIPPAPPGGREGRSPRRGFRGEEQTRSSGRPLGGVWGGSPA